MRHYINYTYPIAIYNCEKKELIGLFKTVTFATRYLFNGAGGKKINSIMYALNSRRKITNSSFNFSIAVRACTQEQKDLLSNHDFIIVNDYPKPPLWQMKGFDSESLIAFGLKNVKCTNI